MLANRLRSRGHFVFVHIHCSSSLIRNSDTEVRYSRAVVPRCGSFRSLDRILAIMSRHRGGIRRFLESLEFGLKIRTQSVLAGNP